MSLWRNCIWMAQIQSKYGDWHNWICLQLEQGIILILCLLIAKNWSWPKKYFKIQEQSNWIVLLFAIFNNNFKDFDFLNGCKHNLINLSSRLNRKLRFQIFRFPGPVHKVQLFVGLEAKDSIRNFILTKERITAFNVMKIFWK